MRRVTAYCLTEGYDIDSLSIQLSLSHTTNLWSEILHASPLYLSNGDEISPRSSIGSGRDMFVTDFGAVVFWNYSQHQEWTTIRRLRPFHRGAELDDDDVQVEEFGYVVDPERTAKIYNDILVLTSDERDKTESGSSAPMTKLALSLAIAQSVKLAHYESLISSTIDHLRPIADEIATLGHTKMSNPESVQVIGRLFSLKSEVNLLSPLLDTPEIFWTEPRTLPIYSTTRLYLEINQRVKILNERVSVMGDLLELLSGVVRTGRGEKLEWVVVILVFLSVVLAGVRIWLKVWDYYDDHHPVMSNLTGPLSGIENVTTGARHLLMSDVLE